MLYEIIIVDDRGNDRSMEIVQKVMNSHQRGNIVRVIHHPENRGLGEARNTIIKNATGKYLFFLDSDDWMTTDCLEKLYVAAEREQAEIVCGSAMQEVEATQNQAIYFQYENGVYEHEAVGALLLSKNIQVATTAWNKLYRMDFIRKYDIHTIHRVFEDQWFSYTAWLYAHKMVLLSDLTLFYNIRMASIMTSGYGKKGTDESARCCCEIVNKLRALIDGQFPNSVGAYDLYYKAIKSNLDILSSSVYTDKQLAYIHKELDGAATKVPSVKVLHTARYRFIYLCSRIYKTAFSFYYYDEIFTKLFDRNDGLIRKLPYSMKKVLFISHEGSRTGAPLVLLSLVKAASTLFAPQNKPCVIFLEEGPIVGDFKPYARVFQIDAHHSWRKLIPYKTRKWLNRKLIMLWAKRHHFDLIYANTVGSLAEGIQMKRFLEIPLWLHIHETERTCHRRHITKEMFQQCEHFISVSSLSTNALANFGVPNEKISIVRPFSEYLTNTDVKPVKLTDVDDDTFVIGLSGVGGWRKGSDVFPMVVKNFVTKHPNVNCKFVWLGGLRPDETPYDLKHLEIEKYVLTPGLVSNPMDYYKRFDVFLLTSREDPFPLVCMENAALANPIIMFQGTSGIADLVKDQQTGLQVPYLDVEAMSDAIFKLYSDRSLRTSLGSNLRMRLLQNFSKEKSIGQLLRLLGN